MRRPALHVALALSLVLAGCSVFGDEPVREERAIERLDAARERAETVESYRYEVDIDASTTASGERIDGSGSGRVNVTTRRQAANVTVGGSVAGSYVDDRTAFEQCRTDGLSWGKENVSAGGNWTELTPLGRQLSVLSTGDLYYNGTETVDGRRTVHLSSHPSPSALEESDAGAGNRPVFGSPGVDSVTVDIWLDETTNLPVRSRVTVRVSGDGETATATLTTRFRDYGDRVEVTIPDDVRSDAMELGCPGD
ncbi:hypothetical protein [Haloarcula nitratireducens]|uniref:Lipoprotein n=1 Tax=Haloarcula nitratireducens TaxID=2487749 RepID=A0AAW4PA29_9EURY|nr:hypothetical protein [Halomicroarcula nitratireducens]MBX0294764.1 hypothetical protein [Halomicroarcula nitratireducens]